MNILIKSDEIINVDVNEIVPFPKNRNNHTAEQLDALCQIIKYQGFRDPLIVSKRSGYLISGHLRLAAAKKLGMNSVPVLSQEFDSDEQEYAAMVSENSIASWAELDFSGINSDLGDLGPDFNIDMLGIENFEIDVADKDGLTDPDDVPEPPKEPKTKRGDIYKLGNHKLMCGDSTMIDDVEKLMDGEKADMVFTDPPYNTGMKANDGSTRLNHFFDDDFSPEDWAALLNGFVSSAYMFLKDDSAAYICLDWRRSHELVPVIKNLFHLSNLIIWDKVVHGLGSDYKYTHEFIHVCKKGKPEISNKDGDREYQDVWRIQRKMGKDDEHATKKPIELVERAINHASKRGELVLDLFGGSGSTLMAAEKNNRRANLMELIPSYCDVTISRWENFTGQKAELINAGNNL